MISLFLGQGLLYFQLLLMAFIDPTGFLPWLATATAAKAAKAINMAQSREHEMQADATGLQIAAAACYNVNQGVHVMQVATITTPRCCGTVFSATVLGC